MSLREPLAASMTRSLPAAVAGQQCHDQAAVLADIMQDHIQVALWDRQDPLPPELVTRAWAQGLGVKCWLDVTALDAAMRRALPGDDYQPLRDDLALLADMTACLFGVSGIGLRVMALTQPMCPRFHVDRIPVRLLCTYGGPGSQWLPADAVQAGLLTPGEDQSHHYRADQIQQLTPGQVALFKGDTWRDNPGQGVVHRSPPVSPGQQRLLVTLDI